MAASRDEMRVNGSFAEPRDVLARPALYVPNGNFTLPTTEARQVGGLHRWLYVEPAATAAATDQPSRAAA